MVHSEWRSRSSQSDEPLNDVLRLNSVLMGVVFFAPIKASREVSVSALVQPDLIKAILT